MPLFPKSKSIWGWALYDWANSAFATSVMAGFFPIFFKQYWSAGANVNLSTARLGIANAVAGILVAMAAPALGAMADKAGARKRMLLGFALIGAGMTATLALLGKGQWAAAAAVYSLAAVGFSCANIFYDALLPAVAAPAQHDYVSGFGYAMGYLGGGLLFLLNVTMTLKPAAFGLADAASAVQLSFVMVALWWAGFSLFVAAWVPESPGTAGMAPLALAVQGWRQALATARGLTRCPDLLLFLGAYWCYIDGVDTVIRMAVDYGLALGFKSADLMTALLMVQFIGFPAALGFGRLGERWDGRKAIYLAIGVYALVTVWAMVMQTAAEFYGLAVLIGLTQGGIQALSRSFYARLIPAGRAGEFFGFYNMLGKFAVIVGPLLMGATGLAVRHLLMPPDPAPDQAAAVGLTASRFSIAALLILFAAGAALLHRVDPQRCRQTLAE